MVMNESLNKFLLYGKKQGFITEDDFDYVANGVMDLIGLDTFFLRDVSDELPDIETILKPLLDFAVTTGRIKNDTTDERDLFDTRIMDVLLPKPSVVKKEFESLLTSRGSMSATQYFYTFNRGSNYIRTKRSERDKKWSVDTVYGQLDLTINLAKPEKDPKTIALAKSLPTTGYPKCVLCKENVGYAGHLNHPARQNHRIMPIDLMGKQWYLQYSPYVYYDEHCIMFSDAHEPMTVSVGTFEKLLDFVSQFKHYFAGSNADLPIVGGSILSHDHFQGGAYQFAMNEAQIIKTYEVPGFSGVSVGLLSWPLTTLRLKGEDVRQLSKLGGRILDRWRLYSDASLDILAFSGEVPHNTMTPIARFKDGLFELDLVLRNNRTNDLHPDGIFHPHEQYHHLKKENIGLIEVMGLAILPGRLLTELSVLSLALLKKDVSVLTDAGLDKHIPWYGELCELAVVPTEEGINRLLETQIGLKFAQILACCGVFKLDEAGLLGVDRFMEFVGKDEV